jgi:hypothetical protein
MAVIKKYAENLTTPLTNYGTFLNDTNPNSDYFRITEFKDTLTGGKNGFLIEGSEHLMESTELKVEILDVAGNPVYWEPGNGIPEYYEGLSKVVSIYVYQDTPIGLGKITILGEAKTYVDENGNTQDIPDEWKNVYNLKWERNVQINRLLSNEDKVRFYRRPTVTINEIVKPIFSNVVTSKTQTGILNGISQTPIAGTTLKNYTSPTTYLLQTVGNSFWTGSVVGTYLSIPGIDYAPLVTEMINSREIIVQPPYNSGGGGLVQNFQSEPYTATFNYTEGVDNLKTALTGSFAKITLADLTTFVGDCARVKIFRKSTADLSDFQFVQEIQLESNEILVDLASTIKNQENYGLFDSTNYKSYWVTSSNSLITSFDQKFLFDSIKLNSTSGVGKFFTTKSLNVNEDIEYTLNFNARKELLGNSTDYIEAYFSGSRQTTVNGTPTTIQIKQSIITLQTENSLLQKQAISKNIKAEQIDDVKLYFDVKGADWHISDVSLKASQETAFSPDEITFIQSVPRTLPAETFVYRFEFYDINNNYIPVNVEATKTFDGGNLQTIRKGLRLVASSAGFQFDSGSNPVPPTIITIEEQKTLLTGSVHYTSQSFDFFGNALSSSQYTASVYAGPDPLYSGSGQYPGVLQGIGTNNVFMRVQDFTGSRSDINVQLIRLTGEVEGYTDTINIYKILDGFGGVNHIIRPYRGTQIRNSSTASLELQAVRIDGINDIILSKQSYKNFSDIQLHILKTASADYSTPEQFVNLSYVTASNYIKGLVTGSLGSGQIDYNAVFNRDSIDFRRIVYLMPSSSAASGPAYAVSSSVLASIILEDLQDGLDSGVVTYNADSFAINPRTETEFRPTFGFATASFSIRGTAGGNEFVTSSFQIYPSMSLNKDWVPEYWMYYHTQSLHPTMTVVARDDNKNLIPSQVPNGNVRSPLNQTKNLTLTFTYTEPWTSASVSLDKTFTIVPDGKPGDETIIFEVVPSSITLGANSRGIVGDYKPSITDIKLKQGSRYLSFSGSAGENKFTSHGQFYIATGSIIESNIKAGNVQFTSSNGTAYTSSLIVSASSDFRQLSGSITYPLIIHPYFTSSIYTASVVVNYTKILEGAPPIQVIITPNAPNLKADEVGYISDYTAANTTIQVKDGDDFLRFTTQSTAPGTFRIQNGASVVTSNIRTGSIASSSFNTATVSFQRFDYPFVSASAQYNIVVYPYALGPGHEYTSSVIQRTQTFTKNVAPPNARSVNLKASFDTVNFNKDGVVSSPLDPIILTATATNTTGAVWFQFFKDDTDYTGIVGEDSPGSKYATTEIGGGDATGPGENATWTVRIRDGNSSATAPIRAENSLTIAGIKAGADAYKLVASNENTSITADLWTTSLTGTGMKITTFKGTEQLTNVSTPTYNTANDVYDFLGNYIGNLGFSSASIFYTSSFVTQSSNKIPTSNPASIGDIASWYAPAINKSGQIVYKIDFENNRQVQFVTQSISVQFEPPAPYIVNLTNENSSAVYKVSGQFTLSNTGTDIRVYRGGTELTNKPAGFVNPQIDAYGVTGYKDQVRISVYSKSSHITLANSWLPGSYITGVPAQMPNITGWADPNTNPNGEIVYQVECEGRQTLYKTQSLSVQFEGSTGPGIVMRGEWTSATNYSGSVETRNFRRDAVIYGTNPTKYYAAVSGSGPQTYNKSGTLVGSRAPSPGADNAWWQYLGEQEFFVAAKIAIFDESFVKNTINVGNNSGSAFANIVLAGGREDPYMAIGQYSTIGYGNTGIWLGIYDDGTSASTFKPRFSLVNGDNSRFMKWTGTDLEIKGSITVTGGDAATQGYANAVGVSAVASANGFTGTAINLFSGSLGAMAAISKINAGQAATYIGEGAIVTNLLASTAITSLNYSASIEAAPYSDTGTFLNLSDGSIKAPGFAIQANGNASFRGRLNSSDAIFGGWKLDATTLASSNGRISFDASKESITVLDTSNNPRFIANTEATLPSVTANAPSPTSGNGSGFSFDLQSINDSITLNGSAYGSSYVAELRNILSFTAATGGGSHLITYTYNPASLYSSYVYANGSAYASLGITLVVTDASDGNIQYGTGRYFYADGDFVDQCGGGSGGYYPIPSVIGTTEIILKDGSIKLAKDIVKGEEILSWDEINNKFTIGKINDIRGRQVDLVYKVVVGGEEVKVSDSHKFWTDNDGEIIVTSLVAGVSKIYVKVNNTIELKVVDSVEVIYEKDEVFTFSVKDYHNYVSNNVISHNSPSYCYYLTSQTAYVSKPSTFTITTGNLSSGGSYKVQLYVTYTAASADTSAYTTYDNSEARVVFQEPYGAVTLKRISAGTIANGGGFQTVTSETQYLKHDKNSTTGYNTEIKGGLAVDKIYGFSDTLNNAATPAAFTNIGYDVAGYAMIKGYARWASNVSQTGTPTIPTNQSLGGVVTSLVSAGSQGNYNINFALTKADGTLSYTYPSIFFTGTRDIGNAAECTFTFGKFAGDSTYMNFKTQDNNTDGLFNMDEIGVIVVM